MIPEIRYNYPVYYESTYIFPTRYYLNVTTGTSIIKRDQLIIGDCVKIGPKGLVVDHSDNEDIV
jgi:hypothetical protein